MPPLTSL